MIKNLPAMQQTYVRSLSWENPLEEGLAIHSSVLAWRIPWTEEHGGLQSLGSKRVEHESSLVSPTPRWGGEKQKSRHRTASWHKKVLFPGYYLSKTLSDHQSLFPES